MAQQIQLGISADIPQIKPAIKFRSKYQKWQHEANYRKAENNKCCKNCNNSVGFKYHNKNYYKCNIQGISHGAATDIRLSYVCDYYAEEYKDCQLCKHLGCNTEGQFTCSLDGEVLDHEGIYCDNFEKYLEEKC